MGLVKGLEQAIVAHDGGDHGAGGESAVLVEIDAADVHDQVAVHHVAALVHGNAAVGVAVVGKAHVEALLDHVATQAVDVGGAAVHVDVEAVGRVVDHANVGAKGIKDGLGHGGRGTVGAVQANLHALQREVRARDEVRDVAVAALHVVNGAADGVAGGQGHLHLAVNVVLDLLEDVLVHLVALAVDELDAVVGVGVVARGDDDAAVEIAVDGLVRHAGRGDDVQQVGVGAGGHQAGNERGLKHVAGATGVLAHHDAGLLLLARTVVPAHKAADLEGVLDVEPLVGAATEAIGAKVLHVSPLSRGIRIQFQPYILPHGTPRGMTVL